ncbi:MAG: SDR family oxidoreductase, partial [Sphingomonadales bacterium]
MIDPLFDFSGQVALVTGGSRGLGRQMALALAARGADIIIASRKADACEVVAEEVRALGRRALAIAAHVGRWAECDALAEAAIAGMGRVDVLINNAGMGPRLPSHQVTEAMWDSVLNLNLKGPFRLASQIGRRMFEQAGADGAGGVIINISSIASLAPMPEVVPYAAAKAGLNAMTTSLARELAPKVRVNAIAAGPFLTDIALA